MRQQSEIDRMAYENFEQRMTVYKIERDDLRPRYAKLKIDYTEAVA